MKHFLNSHLDDSSSNMDYVPGIFNVPGEGSGAKGKRIAEEWRQLVDGLSYVAFSYVLHFGDVM